MPQCRFITASSIDKRPGSTPTAMRRGCERLLGATSAWTSTSIGRVPSRVTSTQEPAAGSSSLERKIADGLETAFSPLSVMANTPSSLAAPKRFLTERIRRNRLPESDSK